MVSTRYSSVTVSKLVEIVQVLNSLHSWMESLLGIPVRDLGLTVNDILAEAERRKIHAVDNVDIHSLDKRRLIRIVRGAMDMTIQTHGPITKDWSLSAAKRAVGFMLRNN